MRNTAFVFVAMLAIVAGCAQGNSQELSRSKAAVLIQGSKQFQQLPISIGFAERESCYLPSEGWLENPASTERILEAVGFVEILLRPDEATRRACGTIVSSYRLVSVRFTAEGVKESRNWERDDWGKGFKVPVGTRKVVEVTGIARDGNKARVEMKFRFEPTGKIGERVRAIHPDGAKIFGSIYRGEATFELYDDGWRVVGVK